ARMITGSASLSAASAALRLPPAVASSTLRTKLRSCERRALLISVRRAIWRTALRAEEVLGMALLVCGWPLARALLCGHSVKTGGGERLAATSALIMAAPCSVNGSRRSTARAADTPASLLTRLRPPSWSRAKRAGDRSTSVGGGDLGCLRGSAAQAVIGCRYLGLLACSCGGKRRLDPPPSRVAMDVRKERLDPGHQRLAVEQLANAHGRVEGSRVAAAPCARTKGGVEIGGGRGGCGRETTM